MAKSKISGIMRTANLSFYIETKSILNQITTYLEASPENMKWFVQHFSKQMRHFNIRGLLMKAYNLKYWAWCPIGDPFFAEYRGYIRGGE